MLGNAWEWCSDWFGQDYYALSPPEDPPGPFSGDRRVMRGGGFANHASICRCATRRAFPPDYNETRVGMRVLLETALGK